MMPALVFSYSRPTCAGSGPGARARSATRDAILYANAEAVLASTGAVETKTPGFPPAPAAKAGFIRIGSDEQVLAMGLDAHLALADYQKCTLLAEEFDLDAIGGSAPGGAGCPDDETINGLLWSCLNTRRALVIGRRAWSAAQLLPFADLRFHATPPMRWIRPDDALDREKILLINHEKSGSAAEELRAALASYVRVEVMNGWTLDGGRAADIADLNAGVHLHVGEHGLASDTVRLVDSWINRIPVLHVPPRRPTSRRAAGDDILEVRHAQNGFNCTGIGEVLTAYEDLRNDRVLRVKLADGGARAVTPLAESWKTIAAELLDG